jgi:chromate reductase
MSTHVRILGIAGSLRRASYNRAALRAATQLVPKGATLAIFELDGIPGFNQDDEQNPPKSSWGCCSASSVCSSRHRLRQP